MTLKVIATETGKKYETEFHGVLPGVRIPEGIDCLNDRHMTQVVWIGDQAYYVCQCVASGELYLAREKFGVDYGGNVHRTAVAPASTAGIEADMIGLPITGSDGTFDFVVVD